MKNRRTNPKQAKPAQTIAVISDIHGNTWALEAVLQDIGKRKIVNILNLGDTLYGPLDPAGTAKILMNLNLVSVSGNEDRLIWETSATVPASPTLQQVREVLGKREIEWLKSFPKTLTFQEIFFLCHGTPLHDNRYLLERIAASGVELRNEQDLQSHLQTIPASVILCGHSHVPRFINLSDQRLIVNAGSVGLQAYWDDSPFPHAMENGTPQARYVILNDAGGFWQVKTMRIPYDWERAAREAEKNQRPDWAYWLRCGRVRREQ